MKIHTTNLPGVLKIEPQVYKDERGFFSETYSMKRYKESGIDVDFVQDCHSRSSKNVLRGLHYQLNNPQGKLVRVTKGSVFDVAVDIRVGSKSFGQSTWTNLTDENHTQLYIPPGFAHGFCVLSDYVDFEYKCTDFYNPEDEGCINWEDVDLEIPWPITKPIVSAKDNSALPLKEVNKEMLPKLYPDQTL
jgi:dTDP-4-dehydrorhamnose 3,5-epimerase